MNSKKLNNIYELSKEIEEGDKVFENQARQIVNAYRQVESLKVQKQKHHKPAESNFKNPSHSAYSIKVKETLTQLKNSKAKVEQGIRPVVTSSVVKEEASRHHQKLIKAGLDRLASMVQSHQEGMRRKGWKMLVLFMLHEQEKQKNFTKQFRMFKLLLAWKKLTIQSLQSKEQRDHQMLQNLELAKEFSIFNIIKKSFKGWLVVNARDVKKREYQKQLRRIEIERVVVKKEEKSKKENVSRQNNELQGKLRGFLDGLKDNIEHNHRLNTIKEHTQESDLNIRMHQEHTQTQHLQEESLDPEERGQQQEGQQNNHRVREIVIQPPEPTYKKPMTSEQLDRKRKELEIKHKKRKETLQKLKKEKDERQKQQNQQRIELQKGIQIEQKRLKQEKYRQFLKNKKDQEQWQIKQKQLEEKAEKFNRKRLLKHHGWIQLRDAKQLTKQKGQKVYQTLLLILFRFKGTQFVDSLNNICNNVVESNFQRMRERYRRKLITRSIKILHVHKQEQLETKQELFIRHQVNQLKISFASWKRIIPCLAAENYDWERPRIKRANQFNRLQLQFKSLVGLRSNKETQKREKKLSQQKQRLRKRVEDVLKEQEPNFDQYL